MIKITKNQLKGLMETKEDGEYFYHASNKSFESFDLSFVKTGAEITKYGYGFYFASTFNDALNHCKQLLKGCYIYTCKLRNRDNIKEYHEQIDYFEFKKLMEKLADLGYEEDAESYMQEYEEYDGEFTYGDVYGLIAALKDAKFASQIFSKIFITGFEINQDLINYKNPIYVIFDTDDIKIIEKERV